MRLYETTFIVRPDLEAEQVSALRDQVKELLTELKAPQVRWEAWGKRKLAYPIRKYPKGIYLYVLYLGELEVSEKIERFLRLNEDCIRSLTVKVLDNVDAATFDFEAWSAKLNPLADRKDAGEFDDVSDDDDKKPPRRSASRDSAKSDDDSDSDDDDDSKGADAGADA